MIPKAHAVLIQASCIFLLLIGGNSGQGIISSRGCLPEYDGGERAYYNVPYSYDRAKRQCKDKRGAMPMPTQLSWSESLSYADHMERKNKEDTGIWIGVTVTKSEKSGVIFTDGDSMQLNDTEIKRLSLSKNDSRFANLKNRRLCIVYYPLRSDRFRPQECQNGRARVVCRCTTGLQKRKVVEQSTKAPPLPPRNAVKAGQTSLDERVANGNESILSKANSGIPSNRDEKIQQKGTDVKKEDSPASTVTTILGIILSVCVIATAFFIVKSRGKRLRDRISRQMPYNRSHSNEDGDSCRQGPLHSEDSSGYHRPIHVYEEILMRNPNAVLSCSSPGISNGHAVSATLPRLPPPEPPCTFVEIHEIRPDTEHDVGYMRPSIHRTDGIPGDVRSPPPTGRPVFDFPSTPDGSSSEGLLEAPQQELKYASVETVQTLLDGGVQNDEEYFIHEEDADADYSSPSSTPIFIKMPEKQYEEGRTSPEFIQNNRNSVANPYVDVNELTACSPPPPGWSGEYENERFLRTVMKVPPKKPRRTMKKRNNSTTASNHLQSTSNGMKDSERSPTSPNLPLYAHVNKTTKHRQNNDDTTGYIESDDLPSPQTELTIGYTPMGSNSSQIMHQTSEPEVATYADIPELPEDTWLNNQPQQHDYEQVPVCSKRNLISHPVMLSTTNAALSESSLVCYEIPPEELES